MTYNLLETVKDYEGQPLLKKTGETEVPTTWQTIMIDVVNSIDNSTTPEEKKKIFAVTTKAFTNPSAVEYSADEVALILSQIEKFSFPVIIGQADKFFNQSTAN
jgi:tRNA(Leu) C34 or U34 (ribose-2'-O)-methylase TrmL